MLRGIRKESVGDANFAVLSISADGVVDYNTDVEVR